jgi:hypothetical protein
MISAGRTRQRGAGLLLLLIFVGTAMGYYAVRNFGRTSQSDSRIRMTNTVMVQAADALVGYAATHVATDSRPYLPCPDKTTAPGPGTANDGQEDRNAGTGVCASAEGNLPWVTLGLVGLDGWSHRLRYRVTPAFSNSVTGMQLTSVGILSANSAAGAVIASALPMVLVSHGPNAWGATSSSGVVAALPPVANTSERENTDGDLVFIRNAEVASGGVGGEFDDLTHWFVTATLLARMQAAGRL